MSMRRCVRMLARPGAGSAGLRRRAGAPTTGRQDKRRRPGSGAGGWAGWTFSTFDRPGRLAPAQHTSMIPRLRAPSLAFFGAH